MLLKLKSQLVHDIHKVLVKSSYFRCFHIFSTPNGMAFFGGFNFKPFLSFGLSQCKIRAGRLQIRNGVSC
jgi:hypothetical protein